LPVFLAGAIILGMPPPAAADFTLTLHQQGYTDLVVADGGGLDSNTQPGVIVYSGSFGTFNVTAEIGTSNSAAGVEPAYLAINNLAIQNTSGSGVLTITLQDTGFTAPRSGQATMVTQLSTTSVTTGGSVTIQSYLDGQAGTQLALGTAPAGASVEDTVMIGQTPYTMTNVTTVSLGAGGMLQSTGTTTVHAPAPGGLELALSGLAVGALGLCWRRLRKRAPAMA
jgi:hypothetical protein